MDLARAHVSYASSDPKVATVSRPASVTAVGHGVATISVTVNGVTGTTPVTVQQPFSLSAPAIGQPGSTATVTTALPDTGPRPLSNVSMTLDVPSGWTATATSPATFATVAPGQTAQTTWKVAIPADAQPGSGQLTANASYTDANGRGSSTATGTMSVPYASLSGAFDNPAISADSNPTAGNLDGDGRSYSAEALAAAGLTAGGTVSHDGVTFTWPDAQPASPDNVVADGQTIALSGSGSTLGFLGTANNGTVTGTGTITYTDGSTQSFSLSLADWWANAAAGGGDIVASTPYLNSQDGTNISQKVSVYYASVPLQAGKQAAYVTLPGISQGVANGQPAMHIFALGIG